MIDGGDQRRLSAILAADVVGYTRLMEQDTDGTVAAWKSARSDVIDPTISNHAGRIVKHTGDGFLAEFQTVQDAVNCALAMQDGLETSSLDFRMGINLGDIIDDGEDIHGEGVNIAARIEALADPGSIWVSGMVFEAVRNRVSTSFEDMGEHSVKHVSAPIRVYRIAGPNDAASPSSGESPKVDAPASDAPTGDFPDKPSIAVLPFNNMSGDPEQEYFSDGITEDIITDLAKVSGLLVIARNSTFVYKGKAFNVPDVCRELGVGFALEGSIRKAGTRVRITAQLIDGSSGGHIWGERYDRELIDIFEVQDDVAQQIVGALKVTLSPAEKSLIVDGGTRNVEAHDLFLKGRALIFGAKKGREMFDQATAYFRRAIELDPNYGGPYAGLGQAYMLDHQNRWSNTPETSLDQAGHFVDEAIIRDDKDPFTYYVAALVAMWKKDYERWADAADMALSLNPNFAPALNARGVVHIYTGEPAKAVPYIERAMRLDPAYQQQYIHFLGTSYFVAGDYETAATLFRDRISISPTTDLSRAFLASTLGHLSQPDEARKIWDELKEINPDYSFAAHIGRLPFKYPADAEKFTDGLRKSGIVE